MGVDAGCEEDCFVDVVVYLGGVRVRSCVMQTGVWMSVVDR